MDEQAALRSEVAARPEDRATDVVLERGPGVHVVADAHPARAGRALAAALGADLADTAATAERAIGERLGKTPGGSAPADVIDLREGATGDERADASSDARVDRLLAERLAAHNASGPTRTLAAAHVARLRLMAAALDRADRIATRTQRAASERLGASVKAGPAAPHASLSRASADLLSAQRKVDALEAAAEPPVEPGATLQQIPPPSSSGPTPKRRTRSSDSALIAGGVLLLSVALAGAILLTALPPILAIAPILLGLFVAALIRRTTPVPGGRVTAELPQDTVASSPRAQVSINAPTAAQARPPPVRQAEVRVGDPAGADLAGARKQLEDARQRWTALAGSAADPRDVDGLSPPDRARAADAPDVVSETAAVRAAAQVARNAREAWDAAWAEFGEEAPADAAPGPALEAAMVRLRQRIEADSAEADAGERSGSGVARDIATPRSSKRQHLNELLAGRQLQAVLDVEPGPPVLVRSPLVLVEPFAGLNTERRATMQRQLEMLASHHEVIVIVHSGQDRPGGVGS